MRYQDEDANDTRRIGALYIRPLSEVTEIQKRMDEMTKCNLIIGDLNARNPIWGGEAGDDRTNAYGRKLQQWINKENRIVARTREKTFRKISVLDITIYKQGNEAPKRQLTDKCGLEHQGQIIRLKVKKPNNLKKENVAWKKVDWKKMEEELTNLEVEKDGGWEGLKGIIDKLPKANGKKVENKWWTKELEKMARDTRKLGREGQND